MSRTRRKRCPRKNLAENADTGALAASRCIFRGSCAAVTKSTRPGLGAAHRAARYVDHSVLIDTREYVDGRKAGPMQERYELVPVPLAHGQGVVFTAPVLGVGPDRQMDAAVGLVDVVDADAQRDLAAGRFTPIPHVP